MSGMESISASCAAQRDFRHVPIPVGLKNDVASFHSLEEEIMDHQAFAQMLGNYGEFVGAIAVVVTLVYLASQVRHNTRSLNEGRKLALAQTYQARAALYVDMTLRKSDPERLGTGGGQSNSAGADDGKQASSDLDRYNQTLAWRTYADNVLYQYQNGYIEQEYYDGFFKPWIRHVGRDFLTLPVPGRASFLEEVKQILDE